MIPKNWDNIRLDQFVAIQKTKDAKPKTQLEVMDLQFERVCYLLDINLAEALKLPTKILGQAEKLVRTPLPTRLMLGFKFKGRHYKLISDARECDAGRYTAIMNLAKRSTLDNLHQIMYNIVQPVKYGFKKQFPFVGWVPYELEAHEHEQVIKDFKRLPMKIVNPATVFFLKVSSELTKAIQKESDKKLVEMEKKLKQQLADLQRYSGEQ